MGQAWRIFQSDLRLKVKRAVAYPSNFALHSMLATSQSALICIFQFLLYAGVSGYPNWDGPQILLFEAVLLLWASSVDLLFGGVRGFIEREVVEGKLDRVFLYPAPALVSIFCRGSNLYAAPAVLAGAVGVMSLCAREGRGGGLEWLSFAVFFLCGLGFYLALLIGYCAAALFLVKMERLRELLERIVFFGSFPTDVFFGVGQLLLLSAFPVALWAFLPAQALLGRVPAVAWVSLPVTAAALGLAIAFWRQRERSYISAGG